jgi:hypothetical protein
MLRRPMLARLGIAAAALVGAVGTVAVTAPAQAATQSPLPHVHVVNLQSRYGTALVAVRQAGHRKIGGIEYAIGRAPHAAQTSTACLSGTGTEPNCPLAYGGGPVQHSPRVYLVLWGPKWSSGTGPASAAYLEKFYAGLGVQPKDKWSTITSQYTDSTGHPTFASSVFMGTWLDTSTPPIGATQNQLAAEAVALSRSLALTNQVNAQVIVATQTGTCPQGFYAPNCNGGNGSYCAWHSNTGVTGANVTFTNLPYLLDAGSGCGQGFVNGANGTNDGWSMVGGHEYAETITDPYPPNGWYDPNDNVSGGEIGDKCAWGGLLWNGSDPYGNVTLSTGTFAMQSLWSNTADACVMWAPVTDQVSLTSPGRQVSYTGYGVRLAVPGGSTTGSPTTWTATGLPSGLSINASTGLITGTPKAAGSNQVTVKAVDQVGNSGSVTFWWRVNTPTGKPITGFAGKCLADYNGITTPGNKIDIWNCTGSGAQKWVFTSNGSMEVLGQCVTDLFGKGAGTKLVLAPCTGAHNTLWTHRSNGEYVLKLNGLCLTDPGWSKTNGTQVILQICKDYTSQRWSLP